MPPPYIRVLAMNQTGKKLLKTARMKARLPLLIKPASVNKLPGHAKKLFYKETAATDLYVLAYQNENERTGGQEWRQSPFVISE